MLSVEEYVSLFELDDEEEVNEEIAKARESWVKCGATSGQDQTSNIRTVEKLMTHLGASFQPELATSSTGTYLLENLSEEAFVDFYLRWLFQIDEDVDGANEEEDLEGDSSGGKAAGNWSNIKWTVTVPIAVDGESWKCDRCKIVNQWETHRCLGCDNMALHAPANSFGGSSSSTSFSTNCSNGSITSAGFSFGVKTSSSADDGAAPNASGAASGTAPISSQQSALSFSFGVPNSSAPSTVFDGQPKSGSTGFTFGVAPPSK